MVKKERTKIKKKRISKAGATAVQVRVDSASGIESNEEDRVLLRPTHIATNISCADVRLDRVSMNEAAQDKQGNLPMLCACVRVD